MRPYNSATDFPILYKAAQANNNMSLSLAKRVLAMHDIEWPTFFNSNTTDAAIAIDKDLCILMKDTKLQG